MPHRSFCLLSIQRLQSSARSAMLDDPGPVSHEAQTFVMTMIVCWHVAHLKKPFSQDTSNRCGLSGCASSEFARICESTSIFALIMKWHWYFANSDPEVSRRLMTCLLIDCLWICATMICWCVVAHDEIHCTCSHTCTGVLLLTACCYTLFTSLASAHSTC